MEKGWGVLKFVICMEILLFINKRSIVHFCGWRVWGVTELVINVWPLNGLRLQPIQPSSNKPDSFWPCNEQPPAPHHSTDDQTKARVTFSWHLIFYVKKYFGLLNIASWLASNKLLWTRKCNKCSLFIEFFLARI